MKRIAFHILLLFLCCYKGWSQTIPTLDNLVKEYMLIPIVHYTPINFKGEVKSSFYFNPHKNYLFKKYQNDSLKVYWYSDYPSSKGKFGIYESSVFKDNKAIDSLIINKDSIFTFYPTLSLGDINNEYIPQKNRYYGYIENNQVRFFTIEGKIYDSLYSFAVNEFGSLRKFADLYVAEIYRNIYSVTNRTNGVLECQNEQDAVAYLKNSYKFFALLASAEDYPKTIDMFLKWLDTKIKLSPQTLSLLQTRLLEHPFIGGDEYVNEFLRGAKYPEPYCSLILENVLSTKEYDMVQLLIDEENILLASYYKYLVSHLPNVDEKKRYLSDKDHLLLIYYKVFNQ